MAEDSFNDASAAARARAAFERLILQKLNELRPIPRYGTVTALDLGNNRVQVLFPGDPEPVTAFVLGVAPVEVGQVVQVGGYRGDHYVTGVVGQSSLRGVPGGDLAAPTSVVLLPWIESVMLDWNAVAGASRYELQFAEDDQFTVNVRTFVTSGTHYQLSNLPSTGQYWARVRALNNATPPEAGPWSATAGPASPDEQAQPTDGLAPSASPTPVVTPGLGNLFVEWSPVSNPDLVTYEIHIATSSGFTPTESTLAGEITGTFASLSNDAQGNRLEYDTVYFIRLIAKDADGAAPPGPQGSGSPERFDSGDAGRVGVNNITDGDPPLVSPDVQEVHNGVGFLLVRWEHVGNVDPLTYEVHVSTAAGFYPDANTLVGDTPSNFFFIRTQGAGTGHADLQYDTVYHIRIWAKDQDGYAPDPGLKGSGSILRVQGVDITDNSVTAEHMVAGTITAGSAIIADAAIGTAQIQDAAITSLKVATAAISSAKIEDAAIITAKINDLAVSTAKIANAAITNAKINDLSADKITAGSISGDRIAGGTITGVTITGVTINTAASGHRVELSNQTAQRARVNFYRSDGSLVGYIGTINYVSGSWLEVYSPDKVWIRGDGTGSAGELTVAEINGVGIIYATTANISGVYADVLFARGGTEIQIGNGHRINMNGNALVSVGSLNGGVPWTSANDGSGSGLDADLLDGNHASAFASASHSHSVESHTHTTLDSSDERIYPSAGNAWIVQINGSQYYAFTTSGFRPQHTNGSLSLGSSTRRWLDVWAADGSINTSDLDDKTEVAASDLGLDFIKQLSPIKYKWTNGGTRFHYGLGAQDVKLLLDTLGQDAAFYIDPAVSDPDYDPIESRKGLRLHEITAGPLIKAVQELASRVEALEAAP